MNYKKLEIEEIYLENEDIITTSSTFRDCGEGNPYFLDENGEAVCID